MRSRRTPTDTPSLELANRILACQDFEQLASDVLPSLHAYFGAGSSCAFEMRQLDDRLSLGRATQIHMPVRAIADYSAHFVGLDPVCAPSFGDCDPRALAPNVHRVVRLSDRCDRGTLRGSEYYNEFLREIDVQHVFGLMVRPEFDPSRVVVLGFHRPDSERDFSVELEQAAALAPAFHAAVERMCFRSRIEAQAGGVPHERPLSLSFAADAQLLNASGLSEAAVPRRPFYFPALMEALSQTSGEIAVDASWAAMLSDVGVDSVACGARLSVSRAAGQGRAAHTFRLRLTPSLAMPVVDRWAQRVRLTERELDVARGVARGLRNLEVANDLGLSLRTVENHLRSIFAKGGVRSRAQLLAQLVDTAPGARKVSSRT